VKAAAAQVEIARRLRRGGTLAEHRLWAALRNRQVAGAKLRRQAPRGSLVVDFLCHEARLVIEVDGGQHAGSARDTARDALLAAKGWHVVRYWNHEVLGNLDGVLADIGRLIEERRAQAPLTPTLSPAGERGRQRRRLCATSDAGVPSPHRGEGQGEGVAPSGDDTSREPRP
jgi:very-short-patch-repair endonuclease